MVLATIETPQLLLDTVANATKKQVVQVFISVVAPRLTPMVLTVQQTIQLPSCLDKVVDAPICRGAGRRHSCRDTEAIEIPQLRVDMWSMPSLIVQVVHTPVVCNDKSSTSLS